MQERDQPKLQELQETTMVKQKFPLQSHWNYYLCKILLQNEKLSSEPFYLACYLTLPVPECFLNHMKLEDGLMWTAISREERARAGHKGDSSSGVDPAVVVK